MVHWLWVVVAFIIGGSAGLLIAACLACCRKREGVENVN